MTQQHHRAATIFAGIFSLIQSFIWVVLSILFIASYTCKVQLPFNETANGTSSSLLYVAYFQGQCRGTTAIAPSATRTYVWMMVYAVFSAIWIPTSVLLFVAALCNAKGKCGATLYIPWILNTIIISVMDLVATIMYGVDISNTMTTTTFREFIKPAHVDVSKMEGLTVIPSVEMTAFFCRVIIIWVINVVLIGVVIQGARCVSKASPSGLNYSNNIAQGAEDNGSAISGTPIRDKGILGWNVYGGDREREEVPVRRRTPPEETRQVNWEEEQDAQWIITKGNPRNATSWERPAYPPDPSAPPVQAPPTPGTPTQERPPPNFDVNVPRNPTKARIYDVTGKPIADQTTPPLQRKFPNKMGNAPWSYLPTNKSVIEEAREGLKPVGLPIPPPDYTVHIATKSYPSLPAEMTQDNSKSDDKTPPKIMRSTTMSNIY